MPVAMVIELEQLVGGAVDGAIAPLVRALQVPKARDAEAVFEHRLACLDLAEQVGMLEGAPAQQAAGSAEQ